MQIIALQEYTDKFISLYQGEIRNIEQTLANQLIEKGIVAEHDQVFPGGGGDDSKPGIIFVNFKLSIDAGDKEIAWGDEESLRIDDLIEYLQNNQLVIAKIKYFNNNNIYYGTVNSFGVTGPYRMIEFSTTSLEASNIKGFFISENNSISLITAT